MATKNEILPSYSNTCQIFAEEDTFSINFGYIENEEIHEVKKNSYSS